MRIPFRSAGIVFVIILLCSTVAEATSVSLPDKHITVEIPNRWVSERNHTINGTVYDLYMCGPNYEYYEHYNFWSPDLSLKMARPVGTILTAPWAGDITNFSLFNAMMMSINGLKDEFGSSNVQVVAPPSNLTIAGEIANLAVIYVSASGITIREQITIVVSDEWREMCALALAVVLPLAALCSEDFNAISYSISFDEHPADLFSSSMILIIIAGIAVAVIVAVVAIVSGSRNKKNNFEKSDIKSPKPPVPPEESG